MREGKLGVKKKFVIVLTLKATDFIINFGLTETLRAHNSLQTFNNTLCVIDSVSAKKKNINKIQIFRASKTLTREMSIKK